MYYKIENQECEVYKKLHAMRTKEIQYQKENKLAIIKKTGSDFDSFLGHRGQQNMGRVTVYEGFKFLQPENIDLKAWKISKDYPEVHVPNRRTQAGREMHEFLLNGLKGGCCTEPLEILGIEAYRRFTLPFIDIVGDIILIFLDHSMEPEDPNVIEITKKEFEDLRKS